MIVLGDCLEVMQGIEENSIDTIITDPPYGLSFMNKKWDGDVPAISYWEACLRVAKPGAMLLAFGGTRTFHRLAVAIEDAGWEIRDTIMWLYGSGFPKSLNISKSIDKKLGKKREIIGTKIGMPGYSLVENKNSGRTAYSKYTDAKKETDITAPASTESELWDGWGTALKPAFEPIVVAMKPIDGIFANNAMTHGVAGLWIDGSRVETDDNLNGGAYSGGERSDGEWKNNSGFKNDKLEKFSQPQGRFPANIILDEEAGRILDEQTGVLKSGKFENHHRITSDWGYAGGKRSELPLSSTYGDKGGASRFFYCAKASKKEKNAGMGENINDHTSVKPISLMRYLARLTKTPTGGIVLDPFMGSGSTGVACVLEGREFIGIEMDKGYFEIAKQRIDASLEAR